MHDRDTLLASVELTVLADELLGRAGTRGGARMWPCPNPNHHQTGLTPPVSIFTSRRGDQRWRCHGCGDGGTAIDLLIAVRHSTVADAIDELARRAGRADGSSRRPVHRAVSLGRTAPACADPDGLTRYVGDCAVRLWTPSGSNHLRWLTQVRGLPADVLRRNLVGSDPGSRIQRRPDGLPRSGGIVLPVIDEERVVYAQLRVVEPRPDGPRYLNPRSDLAANPRIARIRPVEVAHPEVIVTEGIIDGLSAASAGYRAVAVLSATLGDEAVAAHLAKLPWPVVLGFDGDEAGQAGASRLGSLLATRGRPAVTLDNSTGDLNDALQHSADWPTELAGRVAATRGTTHLAIGGR